MINSYTTLSFISFLIGAIVCFRMKTGDAFDVDRGLFHLGRASMAFACIDIIWGLMYYDVFGLGTGYLYMLTVVYFSTASLVAYGWFLYVGVLLFRKRFRMRYRVLAALPALFVVGLASTNLWTSALFSIGDTCASYTRGSWYIIEQMCTYVYFVTIFVLSLGSWCFARTRVRRDISLLMAIFSVVPGIVGVMQVFTEILPFTSLVYALEVLFVYLFVSMDQTEKKLKRAYQTNEEIIYCVKALQQEQELEDGISKVLDRVIQVTRADRAYVLERHDDLVSIFDEKCKPGVESGKERFVDIPYAQFAYMEQMVEKNSAVMFFDVEKMREAPSEEEQLMYRVLTKYSTHNLLAVPLYVEGELAGYLGISNYENKRLLHTRMLLETVAHFIQARIENKRMFESIEEANKSKSVFLFNMSHDIRTPMNAILGFNHLAQSRIDDKEAVLDALQKIEMSGDVLLRLINDVLEVARIESGTVTPDYMPLDLREEISKLHEVFEEEMRGKEIQFHALVEVRDPYVLCDPLSLSQICMNLLSNAKKFTNRGGNVWFTVRQKSFSRKGGMAKYVIEVKDDGIGMSDEFQTTVFDMFSRERNSTVSGIQGTGLGLSIVKRVVDMLQGTIQLRSKQGKGTTFTITLNLKVLDENLKLSKVEKKDETSVEFAGKRILLVEDNELNQEIAREILLEEGFEVEVAGDGTEAIERLTHAPIHTFDLVLMDIQMPIMDGYKATKEIRSSDKKGIATIPIIAMTANAFEEDKRRAYEAGMDGFIVKPIDVKQMREVLNKVL